MSTGNTGAVIFLIIYIRLVMDFIQTMQTDWRDTWVYICPFPCKTPAYPWHKMMPMGIVVFGIQTTNGGQEDNVWDRENKQENTKVWKCQIWGNTQIIAFILFNYDETPDSEAFTPSWMLKVIWMHGVQWLYLKNKKKFLAEILGTASEHNFWEQRKINSSAPSAHYAIFDFDGTDWTIFD